VLGRGGGGRGVRGVPRAEAKEALPLRLVRVSVRVRVRVRVRP